MEIIGYITVTLLALAVLALPAYVGFTWIQFALRYNDGFIYWLLAKMHFHRRTVVGFFYKTDLGCQDVQKIYLHTARSPRAIRHGAKRGLKELRENPKRIQAAYMVIDIDQEYIDEVGYDWAHGFEPHRSYKVI